MVREICGDERLWQTDLNQLPGFADTVTDHLMGMMQNGVKEYIIHHSKVL